MEHQRILAELEHITKHSVRLTLTYSSKSLKRSLHTIKVSVIAILNKNHIIDFRYFLAHTLGLKILYSICRFFEGVA